jgi:hypothetical protein
MGKLLKDFYELPESDEFLALSAENRTHYLELVRIVARRKIRIECEKQSKSLVQCAGKDTDDQIRG